MEPLNPLDNPPNPSIDSTPTYRPSGNAYPPQFQYQQPPTSKHKYNPAVRFFGYVALALFLPFGGFWLAIWYGWKDEAKWIRIIARSVLGLFILIIVGSLVIWGLILGGPQIGSVYNSINTSRILPTATLPPPPSPTPLAVYNFSGFSVIKAKCPIYDGPNGDVIEVTNDWGMVAWESKSVDNQWYARLGGGWVRAIDAIQFPSQDAALAYVNQFSTPAVISRTENTPISLIDYYNSLPAPTTDVQQKPRIEGSISLSNVTPTQYSVVTVYSQLSIHGVPAYPATMTAVFHYRTTDTTCTGATNSAGEASCSLNISGATHGYTVNIDVTTTYNGMDYQAKTSFTTQ